MLLGTQDIRSFLAVSMFCVVSYWRWLVWQGGGQDVLSWWSNIEVEALRIEILRRPWKGDCRPYHTHLNYPSPIEFFSILEVRKQNSGIRQVIIIIIIIIIISSSSSSSSSSNSSSISNSSMRRPNPSSRGILPTVVRRWVWSRNLVHEKALGHWVAAVPNKQELVVVVVMPLLPSVSLYRKRVLSMNEHLGQVFKLLYPELQVSGMWHCVILWRCNGVWCLHLLGLLDTDDEGTTILRNVGNSSTN